MIKKPKKIPMTPAQSLLPERVKTRSNLVYEL